MTNTVNSMFDPEVISILRGQFDEVDIDKSGTIDIAEAKSLVRKYFCPPGSSDNEVDKLTSNMFRELDTDSSGTITFDEYCFRFGRRIQQDHNKAKRASRTGSSESIPVSDVSVVVVATNTSIAASNVEVATDSAPTETGVSAAERVSSTETGEGFSEDGSIQRNGNGSGNQANDGDGGTQTNDSDGGTQVNSSNSPTSFTAPPNSYRTDYVVGDHVQIQGLKGAAQHNGKRGIILGSVAPTTTPSSGTTPILRFNVELIDKNTGQKLVLAVKPENLKEITVISSDISASSLRNRFRYEKPGESSTQSGSTTSPAGMRATSNAKTASNTQSLNGNSTCNVGDSNSRPSNPNASRPASPNANTVDFDPSTALTAVKLYVKSFGISVKQLGERTIEKLRSRPMQENLQNVVTKMLNLYDTYQPISFIFLMLCCTGLLYLYMSLDPRYDGRSRSEVVSNSRYSSGSKASVSWDDDPAEGSEEFADLNADSEMQAASSPNLDEDVYGQEAELNRDFYDEANNGPDSSHFPDDPYDDEEKDSYHEEGKKGRKDYVGGRSRIKGKKREDRRQRRYDERRRHRHNSERDDSSHSFENNQFSSGGWSFPSFFSSPKMPSANETGSSLLPSRIFNISLEKWMAIGLLVVLCYHWKFHHQLARMNPMQLMMLANLLMQFFCRRRMGFPGMFGFPGIGGGYYGGNFRGNRFHMFLR